MNICVIEKYFNIFFIIDNTTLDKLEDELEFVFCYTMNAYLKIYFLNIDHQWYTDQEDKRM